MVNIGTTCSGVASSCEQTDTLYGATGVLVDTLSGVRNLRRESCWIPIRALVAA